MRLLLTLLCAREAAHPTAVPQRSVMNRRRCMCHREDRA